MTDLGSLGRLLLGAGILLAVLGLLLLVGEKLPWLGRLPGDIVVKKKNFSFYFPLATSIVVSIVLSAVLWLINRR